MYHFYCSLLGWLQKKVNGIFHLREIHFKANFMRLEICYLGPDSAVEGLEEGEEEVRGLVRV